MRPERRTGTKFEVRGLGVDPIPSFLASSKLAKCDKPSQHDAAIFPNRDVDVSQKRMDTLGLPVFYPSIEPKLGFETSEAAPPGYEHGPMDLPSATTSSPHKEPKNIAFPLHVHRSFPLKKNRSRSC